MLFAIISLTSPSSKTDIIVFSDVCGVAAVLRRTLVFAVKIRNVGLIAGENQLIVSVFILAHRLF